MAEVYGVKPKKFTKEWWPYYWMYYKWHTIIIGFFSISTIVSVAQCAMKEHYDLNVVYAGSGYYADDTTAALADKLKDAAIDSDGDGEVKVWVEQINFSKGGAKSELDYNMQTKHDIEMSADTYRLYLYDRAEADIMLNREDTALMYTAVADWAKTEPSEDMLLYGSDGAAYMVNLKDSAVLGDIGMDASDLYVAVSRTSSEEELAQNAHKGAVSCANLLVFGE
ncbi:MAG: hypothetical protein IJH94_03035 [Clostridia bacterium]|nr:hypothetical protein [Clostridia bacterium]